MFSRNIVGSLVLGAAAVVSGCAASPTEREFGNAVRHTLAQQRATPAPAPDVDPTTDGQRVESVMTMYRTMVGDPVPVVREREVKKEAGAP